MVMLVFVDDMQMTSSPRYASVERTLPGDLLLNKLEEVNESVKV